MSMINRFQFYRKRPIGPLSQYWNILCPFRLFVRVKCNFTTVIRDVLHNHRVDDGQFFHIVYCNMCVIKRTRYETTFLITTYKSLSLCRVLILVTDSTTENRSDTRVCRKGDENQRREVEEGIERKGGEYRREGYRVPVQREESGVRSQSQGKKLSPHSKINLRVGQIH